MMGLLYLVAFALYLTVLIVVVLSAWRLGRADGGSIIKASSFAMAGFLLVYLPVFWSLIPTYLAHRHYCAKDAGFTAHVPAEQWYAQHLAEVNATKQLPRAQREATSSSQQLSDGFSHYTHSNGLLASDFKAEQIDTWGAHIRRLTWRVTDAASGTHLATAVDYQSGYDDLRFWLNAQGCIERPPSVIGQPLPLVKPLDFLQAYKLKLKGEPM